MANQQRDSAFFAGCDEGFRTGDVIGERLLDERRNARRNDLQSVFDVQLVGRRNDDAVGPTVGADVGEGLIPSNAAIVREFAAGGRGAITADRVVPG